MYENSTPVFESGDEVILLNFRKARGKARGLEQNIFPSKGFLVISSLDRTNKKVTLEYSTGQPYTRKNKICSFHFDQIKHYKGNLRWVLNSDGGKWIVDSKFANLQRKIKSSRRKQQLKKRGITYKSEPSS